LNCVKLKDNQALNARFYLMEPLCSYPLNDSLVQQCSDTLMPGFPGLSTPETFTCQSLTCPLYSACEALERLFTSFINAFAPACLVFSPDKSFCLVLKVRCYQGSVMGWLWV